MEDAGAGNQPVATGLDDGFHVVHGDTAIDFDAKSEATFATELGKPANLVQGVRDEPLAAEAWVDAHDQNVVGNIEDIFEQRDRGCGIQDYTGLRAVRLNVANDAVEVSGSLKMDGDLIGTGFHEQRGVLVGIRNHQVKVEDAFGDFADGFDNRRTESEVGDEVAIHDIDVQHGGAAAFDFGYFVAKMGEVGREDGRQNMGHLQG